MRTETGRPTRHTVRLEQEKDIRERWFPDHVAEQATHGPFNEITWAKPGTGIYHVLYVIRGRFLFIAGDIGESVYEWSQTITWEFLAGCGLDYFAGKQEAGRYGARHFAWHEEVALGQIEEMFSDQAKWGYEGWKGLDAWKGESVDLSSRDGMVAWLHDGTYIDFFGPEAIEWLPSAGDVWDIQQVGHWLGLQMALTQLGFRAEAVNPNVDKQRPGVKLEVDDA